jgi:hypothetical protein
MDNRSAIRGSRPRNTEFRSIFAPKLAIFGKNRMLTPMHFERKCEIFQNP